MYRAALIVSVMLSLLSGLAPAQQQNESPAAVVERYCQLDFDGVRTRGDTAAKVDRMVLWPEEPGWDTNRVVAGYKVVSVKTTGARSKVTVEYEVLADASADEVKQNRENEHVVFTLKRDSKEWVWKDAGPVLVRGPMAWRIESPVIPPHVSLAYMIKHLESLQADSAPEYQQQLHRTVEKLKLMQTQAR